MLDALYALGDSASLAAALLIVLPRALRLWERPVRRSMLFLAAGMVVMFLSGWIYIVTTYLPDAHPLKFVRGNSIDFGFATAFLLMGVAIGLLPAQAHRN